MKTCSECPGSVYVRGLCRKHYRLLPEVRQKELLYREKYLRSLGHKKGIYPNGTSQSDVEKLVEGTFGGRFEHFGNGKFKYIAYTD